MHFPTLAIAAASFVAITHACYDDAFLSRRSGNGTQKSHHFSYTGPEGPLNWGKLDKENSLCATGKMQTPINLDSKIKTESGRNYVMSIPSGKATIENKGHTVEVNNISNGTLSFNKKSYKLAQFHFHAPSEHRINDEFFPLEVHFVHKTTNGSIAVVGFLIQIGARSDPLLKTALNEISGLSKVDSKHSLKSVNFRSITKALSASKVYRYQGSLTTPPCTEGVEWIVSEALLYLDYVTFNRLKKVLKFNSRYTQSAPGEVNLLANALPHRRTIR